MHEHEGLQYTFIVHDLLDEIILTAIVYKTIDRQTNHGVFKGSNEKSRDDLQKNFHLTVNKIQVLMNMERPQAQAINGLLCGENGLVESKSVYN